MYNRQKKNTAVILSVVILSLTMLTFFGGKDNTAFPLPSLSTILDGTYSCKFENYLNSRFVFREKWVKIKTTAELVSGKKEINGIYITDNAMIKKSEEHDYELADDLIDDINSFADSTKTNVYAMFVPEAADIYADELPDANYSGFIDYMYDGIRENVNTIDVYNTLSLMTDDYIFYRTDSGLTTYGAYSAYKTAIRKLGFSAVTYNNFNIEHATSSFRGNLYNQIYYSGTEPDRLDLYHYENGSAVTDITKISEAGKFEYNSLYFNDYIGTGNDNLVYLGVDCPIMKIKTDIKVDKSILIIKDDFGDNFIPFLTQHYSSITVVDLNYYNKKLFEENLNLSDYSQIMIVYGESQLEHNEGLRNISQLVQ